MNELKADIQQAVNDLEHIDAHMVEAICLFLMLSYDSDIFTYMERQFNLFHTNENFYADTARAFFRLNILFRNVRTIQRQEDREPVNSAQDRYQFVVEYVGKLYSNYYWVRSYGNYVPEQLFIPCQRKTKEVEYYEDQP